MGGKVIDYRMRTKLAVKDIATTFRDGIQARPKGLVGLVASKVLEWEFFTPEDEADPFAQFDEDKPDFSVGATYGIRHARGPRITEFRSYMEASTGGAVLLEVWDRGEAREALLRHGGDLSPASKTTVREVISRLATADPTIQVNESKGRL